jgi:hypothetical protein
MYNLGPHQEREREAMKRMFEEQQKQLVEEILQQVRSSQQSRFVDSQRKRFGIFCLYP